MSGKIARLSRALGAELYTGTITTIDATGQILTDAAGDFINKDIQVGDIVANTTDSSTGGGVVISIDSATQITHTALTGAGDNEWQAADGYSITSADVIIYDMETMPATQVAPKHPSTSITLFVDVADATVHITGESPPVVGSEWHEVTIAANMAQLVPWPFSGVKITKGTTATTFWLLGD